MLKKLNKIDYLFIVLLLACIILNLWKSRYGFASSDESFYVTLVDRFYKGDLMIVDEWHPSQFPAVLLIPFYSIFRLFSNGTDGIILFFRLFYIFFNTLAGIFLYIKTRKYGLVSVFTTCCYLLFTVGEMMASNYNTIGLASFIVFVLIYCDENKSKLKLIISGIFFSITVLCVPMLAIVYFIWALVSIICLFKNKKKIFNEWLFITIGIIIMAIPVTAFMLHGSSIAAILENLEYMFSQGDVHGMSLFLIIKKTLYLGYMVLTNNTISMIGFIIYIFIALIVLLDKKKKQHTNIYLQICILLSTVISIGFYNQAYYAFYSLIPLGFILIILKIFDNKLFKFSIISLIYALAINASSDTIIYATSQGILLVGIGVLLTLSKVKSKKIIVEHYFLLVILICLLVYSKVDKNYGDSAAMTLRYKIEEGPMKYLITNQNKYDFYNNYLNEIRNLDLNNKNVMFFTDNAWMYLINDNIKYATYSTWLWPGEPSYFKSMEFYYIVNDDKKADIIYIPNKDIYKFMNDMELFKQYNINNMDNGIILRENRSE